MVAPLTQLQIITPERVMYDKAVKTVEMRTSEGEMTILPGHIPVTLMLLPGIVHITEEGAEEEVRLAVHDGFVEIGPKKVTILAEIAEFPQEIDLERAEAALARARERFMNPTPEIDIPRARRAWARASTRIELVDRKW